MKSHFQKLVDYNLWANTKIAEILNGVSTEILDREVVSSFSSVRKTAYHIWDAEIVWLCRLQNLSFVWPPTAQFKIKEVSDFVKGAKDFKLFVDGCTDDFLNKQTNYKDTKGNVFNTLNSDIITHCMNHSTFHRGQIITLLRSVGLTSFPQTDFIRYLRDL